MKTELINGMTMLNKYITCVLLAAAAGQGFSAQRVVVEEHIVRELSVAGSNQSIEVNKANTKINDSSISSPEVLLVGQGIDIGAIPINEAPPELTTNRHEFAFVFNSGELLFVNTTTNEVAYYADYNNFTSEYYYTIDAPGLIAKDSGIYDLIEYPRLEGEIKARAISDSADLEGSSVDYQALNGGFDKFPESCDLDVIKRDTSSNYNVTRRENATGGTVYDYFNSGVRMANILCGNRTGSAGPYEFTFERIFSFMESYGHIEDGVNLDEVGVSSIFAESIAVKASKSGTSSGRISGLTNVPADGKIERAVYSFTPGSVGLSISSKEGLSNPRYARSFAGGVVPSESGLYILDISHPLEDEAGKLGILYFGTLKDQVGYCLYNQGNVGGVYFSFGSFYHYALNPEICTLARSSYEGDELSYLALSGGQIFSLNETADGISMKVPRYMGRSQSLTGSYKTLTYTGSLRSTYPKMILTDIRAKTP